MTDSLSKPGLPPVLPYAIGLFMAVPYMVWAILWLFVFPGEKNGFDSPVRTALFATSVPLVVWFLSCSLGFIANNMAGTSEFDRPRGLVIDAAIGALPAAGLCIGVTGALYLLSLAEPWYVVLAPLVLGILIGAAIRAGERARLGDRRIAGIRHTTGDAMTNSAPILKLSQRARHGLVWAALMVFSTLLGWLVAINGTA